MNVTPGFESKFSPPPPPPPTYNLIPTTVPLSLIEQLAVTSNETDSFVSDFHTLWEKSRIFLTDEDVEEYKFEFISALLQDGPTCGLTALTMVANHLGINISGTEVMNLALQKKYTAHGEIFSAQNMAHLAQEILKPEADVTLEKRNLSEKVISALFSEHLVLIPYDTDKNHEPCLKNGGKAHWALLCGIIKTKSSIFVVARQSKSRHLNVWNLEQLLKSNSNLTVPDNNIRPGSVLPADGLFKSLAEHCIVLKKKTNFSNPKHV